ncbi:MAG TPA: hypothetical protein VF549_09580 [Solirubrobacteraceae bacterium]
MSRPSLDYNQGVAASPGRALFFTGTNGLFATTAGLKENARATPAIPPEVTATEGYDHVGDLAYDGAEGGRLLLPLECYQVGGENAGNHCGTGSIAVADPLTLRWRYYVKLDPTDIKKAMWAEVSTDGRSLFTQDGADLLRYDLTQISEANAAPLGPQLKPAARIENAFPFGGATGVAFYKGRLLAAEYDGNRFRVWRIDPTTGKQRLEIERRIFGESEGLAVARVRGGLLQWLVAPISFGHDPTYGKGNSALLSFIPRSTG